MTSNLFAVLSVPARSNIPMAMLLTKATIILLLALGMTVVMQRASAGSRHLVWLVTVAALLFVPALTAWAPLPVRVLPAARVTANEYTSYSGTEQSAKASEPVAAKKDVDIATPGLIRNSVEPSSSP